MSAPVVTGTIALMIQANPALTPNLVKAILQYTAEHNSKYNDLTQGAGFLNARGAVQLARDFAAGVSASLDGTVEGGDPVPWNRHINWGNRRVGGGMIDPAANAWRSNLMWGAETTEEGATVVWGTSCPPETEDCDTVVWGTSVSGRVTVWGSVGDSGDRVVWGTNVVWGTSCGGDDCRGVSWGTSCSDDENEGEPGECTNVVWGTSEREDDEETVVWGTKGPPPSQ
jgi:hypothetical protein